MVKGVIAQTNQDLVHNMRKFHHYAPFILLDLNLLTHLGLAIFDTLPNREKLLQDELKSDRRWLKMSKDHIDQYKRGLATGDSSIIDPELEEDMNQQHNFWSINMLLEHIEWKQIENLDLSRIYLP
jgi:hypothetical protein